MSNANKWPGAMQIGFADARWRNADLPHDWSIEGPYDEKDPSSGPGSHLPTGIGSYRNTFHLSGGHRDKLVTLVFGCIYQNNVTGCVQAHAAPQPPRPVCDPLPASA